MTALTKDAASPTADLLDKAPDLLDGWIGEPLPLTNLTVMPKRSLAQHLEGVEFLVDTIESLDDETLDAEAQMDLSTQLISALHGTREKVDAVSRTLALFAGNEAAAKAERDRLDKRVAFYARQADRLEQYVLALLVASKIEKLDGDTSTLAVRLNPPSVVITAAGMVPVDYMRTPPRPAAQPDKVLIKNALLSGEEVPGCAIARTARLVRS